MNELPEALIVDIDGTLIDSNYQHVIAWQRALRENGFEVEGWTVHRYIGKGGDKMVVSTAGEEAEQEYGDRIRASEEEIYRELIGEVKPFTDARIFLKRLKDQGYVVVLSSSAKDHEVERYVDQLGASETVDGFTSSGDVHSTKPEPDLIDAALEIAGTRSAMMIGDSIWDVEAAKRANLDCAAVLTGGFSKQELLAAGASEVQPTLSDLFFAK